MRGLMLSGNRFGRWWWMVGVRSVVQFLGVVSSWADSLQEERSVNVFQIHEMRALANTFLTRPHQMNLLS